jgi:hypothetical protein
MSKAYLMLDRELRWYQQELWPPRFGVGSARKDDGTSLMTKKEEDLPKAKIRRGQRTIMRNDKKIGRREQAGNKVTTNKCRCHPSIKTE